MDKKGFVVFLGMFILLVALTITIYFSYKHFSQTDENIITEEHKYLVVGKTNSESDELHFFLLNNTGQFGVRNKFDLYLEDTTIKDDVLVITTNNLISNPAFLYGKDNECYYSKVLFSSLRSDYIHELECTNDEKVGVLEHTIEGKLKEGENKIDVSLYSKNNINNLAICINQWSFNIIYVEIPNLELRNIENVQGKNLRCYSAMTDLNNSTFNFIVNYQAFSTNKDDSIKLTILDQDRRLTQEGFEENMYFYEGKDIGMENKEIFIT